MDIKHTLSVIQGGCDYYRVISGLCVKYSEMEKSRMLWFGILREPDGCCNYGS